MKLKVALAPFCSSCRSVVTLGVRPCMADYSSEERRLIRAADKIYFPTSRFVTILEAAGRPTFPSPQTCRYRSSRVLQTLLFQELEWPSPRTRLYFGSRQKKRILSDFQIPFRASGPVVLSTTHLIESKRQLEILAETLNPLVIQELIRWEERIRLVSVCHECLGAWRTRDDPRLGAIADPIPLGHPLLAPLLSINRQLTRWIGLDDILIEWGYHRGLWYFIEMRRPPLRIPGCDPSISRHSHICDLIDRGML